jgi:hypothetical protein
LQYAQVWLLQRHGAVRLLGESVCWCGHCGPRKAPVILVRADDDCMGYCRVRRRSR